MTVRATCGDRTKSVQRNAQLARELVFLGDGAEWIWNIVEENFPEAVHILDWFHATAANYFQKNRQRMDYPTYRAQGYHIGSGTIESAAKHVGSQPMKAPGARWTEQRARHVAKARAAFLSGQWPSLATRRAHLPLAA